ncbi:MAG: chemotaxis protein CheA [Phycisphaerales bacterium]|nr:chemotaxis protein CheA [Phycisphaerales bacterium]
MSINDFDPEILQDFIMESGELLEQLEGDLVDLESTPQDPDLLNQIFRALHTIKGSASFLALTNLVAIAHVAESALNAARNSQIVIGSSEMDLLLAAVDVLKIQFQEITSGSSDLTAAEPQLIESLKQLGNGHAVSDSGDELADEVCGTLIPEFSDGRTVRELELDSSKLDLIDHLASDIDQSIKESMMKIEQLEDASTRGAAIHGLTEGFEELTKTVDFFEIPELMSITTLLERLSESLGQMQQEHTSQIIPRMLGLCVLMSEQTEQLAQQLVVSWDLGTISERLESWINGDSVSDGELPANADAYAALAFDGIPFGDAEITQTEAGGQAAEVVSGAEISSAAGEADAPAAGSRTAIGQIEQTIRVEVGRLESLMNLVGELVLQKNRIGSLSEQIERSNLDGELIEQMEATTSTLDRVTGDIQLAVMRTRMQPLEKLFGKYPRLIRDLASKTEKKINLVIEGADTEVDKSVLEELGDPLVHLLRNSGDHGIEKPEDRIAAGKEETGTIKLIAGHAGSHVRVQIIDDGKGLDREVIGAKAVERGLVSEEQLMTLSDEEVFRFILEAGFSTAEQVSDLSGRGVGMDVVRTNIESKLKGELAIESEKGKGTTLTITIPLTVAIMPAMMVGVGDEVFAIPLTNITEIMRPGEEQISGLGDDPVIHLRGQVYPLISSQEIFDVPEDARRDEDSVVVISFNQRVIGLRVTSVIGLQEIVIKPLTGVQREGPISGATIRNDGSVSLIMDIAGLMQSAKSNVINTNTHEQVAICGR